MKKVSIITVNYNQHHTTEELLYSIFETNIYSAVEIIVVDNASLHNPVPHWMVQYPSVKFIRSEKNLGFAGGNNLGIKEATGDYIFLVNNDTEFTAGLIPALVDTLDVNPAIGVVSPKIKYFEQPEVMQYAGFTPMNYYTASNKCIGQFELDKGQYDNVTGPTGFAHGAAMMVTRAAIEKAGLMHENYFLYYEEMDWCDRIKKAGFEVWVCMQALIYHKESLSVGKSSALKEYFMNRNRILYIRNNALNMTRYFFYIYFLCIVTPRNVFRYVSQGKPNFIPLLFKAIWWNMNQKTNSQYLGYPLPLNPWK